MIMSVSTLLIGSGAATAVSLVKGCIGGILTEACLWTCFATAPPRKEDRNCPPPSGAMPLAGSAPLGQHQPGRETEEDRAGQPTSEWRPDRKSTRLNSSH